MVLLHLRSSQAEFDAYLLATHGIETNQFTLNDARATARASGDGWQDLCESWDSGRERDKEERTRLRAVLNGLKSSAPPAAPAPARPTSPNTAAQLEKLDGLGTGQPAMLDESKGQRVGYQGKELPVPDMFRPETLPKPTAAQAGARKTAGGRFVSPAAQAAAGMKSDSKRTAKAAGKAEAAERKRRTLHIVRPAAGWAHSPSTKEAAKSWGRTELYVGKAATWGPNDEYLEFEFPSAADADVLAVKLGYDDLPGARKRINRGDVRAADPRTRARHTPSPFPIRVDPSSHSLSRPRSPLRSMACSARSGTR